VLKKGFNSLVGRNHSCFKKGVTSGKELPFSGQKKRIIQICMLPQEGCACNTDIHFVSRRVFPGPQEKSCLFPASRRV